MIRRRREALLSRYKCVLADREEITTVSRSMDIDVGMAAVVAWQVGGGGGRQAQEVAVVEGEQVELECLATGGYPEPRMEFQGVEGLWPGRQVG